MSPLKLVVVAEPGTEPWAPSQAEVERISTWLTRPALVYLHPRSAVERVWAEAHRGRPLPVSPWAFRAWSKDGVAHVFVDESETRRSIAWLLLHELAHLDLPAASLLCRAFRHAARPDGYLDTDDGHESHVEEQLANTVADQMLPRLGLGTGSYGRRWWRRRVCGLGLDSSRCTA